MATLERYSVAISARSLVVDPRTTMSDSDMLGGMGLADRRLAEGYVPTGRDAGYRIPKAPLAAPLTRLLCGDNHAVHEVVSILADMVWSRADYQRVKPKVMRTAAHDMACACVAWHRNGTCRVCGGHGFERIKGTPALSERECKACHGTRKVPFEEQFHEDHRALARWLVAEMDRALGRAGPEAMRAVAPSLDL